jgi:DNA polymerase I-like protein with 3'-5' exonuclease and polymerase domains
MSVLQTYNGMDTIATFRLWKEAIRPQLEKHPAAARAYSFSKYLSAPLMYMMTRGILIDEEVIGPLRNQFEKENAALEAMADYITKSLGMGVINFASSPHIIWMLECLGVQVPMKRSKDGQSKSVSRDKLEEVCKSDPDLAPLINLILAWRDRAKMLSILKPELYDYDMRMRTSYKVAGTVTDRLSSSKNVLWTGMNMQNIKRDEDEEKAGHASIRSIFTADPGKKFLNVDLKGADSWGVGLEVFKATGDPSYLNACGSRDLHTHVAKLVWPSRPWTGDWSHDKALAEEFFYRQYDYRFMCKKGGHGSNYLGKPWTLANQMKIPVAVATVFQNKYFREFRGIPSWHKIKAKELQTTGTLTNLFGRVRHFHDRLDADGTLREAIGWLGQSCTAGVTNRAMLRVWALQIQMPWLELEILAQVHDSLLIQFNPLYEAEVIELVLTAMSIPITVTSPTGETRTVSIPLEPSVGWNWAKRHKSKETGQVHNLDGLVEIKPGMTDDRVRDRYPTVKKPGIVDQRLSGIHRLASIPKDFQEVGGDIDDWSLSGEESLGDYSEAA